MTTPQKGPLKNISPGAYFRNFTVNLDVNNTYSFLKKEPGTYWITNSDSYRMSAFFRFTSLNHCNINCCSSAPVSVNRNQIKGTSILPRSGCIFQPDCCR